MPNLADVFAYFYQTDLPTLDLIIGEAARIRAERKREEVGPNAVGKLSVALGEVAWTEDHYHNGKRRL